MRLAKILVGTILAVGSVSLSQNLDDPFGRHGWTDMMLGRLAPLRSPPQRSTVRAPRVHPPRYLNNKTAGFAVPGDELPDVLFDIGESYSGILPISNVPGEPNQLFFWFFPSTNPDATNEIVIWLNGGPGCSSMMGMLAEHGVFTWYPGTLAPVWNPYAWANLSNIVYIDQPVGTGFSVGSPTATSEEEVASQFLGFWRNFVNLFDLAGYKTYVTGESYAGKYCPFIAQAMLNHSDEFSVAGMMILDPVIADLDVQANVVAARFAQYHSNTVFRLSDEIWATINGMADRCGHNAYVDEYLVFPPAGPQPSGIPGADDRTCLIYEFIALFQEMLNPCFDRYNIVAQCPRLPDSIGMSSSSEMAVYFDRDDVKARIHAPSGSSWQECNGNVLPFDKSDPPILTAIPEVIARTGNVIIGQGQLDYVILSNGTLLAIQNMTWGGLRGFQQRHVDPFYVPLHSGWQEDDVFWASSGVLGTAHTERGLTYVEVATSGHMIPEFVHSAAYRLLELLLGRIANVSTTSPFSTDM
ncbi:serine carboxypeptidase [Podospora didyma]|uniref:Carboxypeptidase n=1 Tax=Podospora didyma TaxID=330526 RepID=A0AAE0NYC0_9PEZI|nr:serine carboxypeptidase [Podospora didyma]